MVFEVFEVYYGQMIDRIGDDVYKKIFTIGSNEYDEKERTLTGSTTVRMIINNVSPEDLERMPEGLRDPENLRCSFKVDGSIFNDDILTWENKDYWVVGKESVRMGGSVAAYTCILKKEYDIGD